MPLKYSAPFSAVFTLGMPLDASKAVSEALAGHCETYPTNNITLDLTQELIAIRDLLIICIDNQYNCDKITLCETNEVPHLQKTKLH